MTDEERDTREALLFHIAEHAIIGLRSMTNIAASLLALARGDDLPEETAAGYTPGAGLPGGLEESAAGASSAEEDPKTEKQESQEEVPGLNFAGSGRAKKRG